MQTKSVVLLSGGMDSTTLLHKVLAEGDEVKALSIHYGQRHKKELQVAKRMCADLGLDHKVIDLGAINELLQGSSLTSSGIAVPYGHYAEDTMKATVVPNRNMILLATAIGYAVSLNYDRVAYAAHAGDHAIYPDCRPEFVDAMRTPARIANFKGIELYTPFINRTKASIAQEGLVLHVPYENTWTCYEGKDDPCMQCGTCVERIEAFDSIGAVDPQLKDRWPEAQATYKKIVGDFNATRE